MTAELVNKASVLQALSHHIGAAKGIHADQLAREVVGVPTDKGTERQVRKCIEELRRDGNHVCGTPRDGYFMAATPEELDQTIKFLYDRAMTTLKQLSAMKKIALPDLAGQLHIKT